MEARHPEGGGSGPASAAEPAPAAEPGRRRAGPWFGAARVAAAPPAAEGEAGAARPDLWLTAGRLLVGGTALTALVWLLRRGPLVDPVALFSAPGRAGGFYSTTHILPLMALAGGTAGLVLLLSRRAEAPSPPVVLAAALPLLALWAAAAHALYPHDARADLAAFLAAALLFLAFTVAVGTRGGIAAGLACLAGVGVWLAVLGLRQWGAGVPTPVAWTGASAAAVIPVRITASLRNPNALGAVLVLCMGAATALAVGTRSVLLRLAGLAALLPMAAALPLTFSRGAYLGLALSFAAMLALVPAERRRHALIAAACAALPIAVVALRVPGVAFRVHGIAPGQAGDAASRFFAWRDALSVLRARPLFGAGPGGLEVLYASHAPAAAHGTYGLIAVPGSADNDVLQWAAETGLAGVAALAAGASLFALTVGRGLRARGADTRALGAALGAALLGIALQGGFEATAYVLPVQGTLALALAVLVGAAGESRAVAPAGLGRALGAAAAAGAVAVAVALHAPWPAERTFAQAWPLVVAGHPAAALPGLEAAYAADPSSERDAAAAGDAAVQSAYLAGAAPPASLLSSARTDLTAALRLDPFDGDTWAAAAALLRLGGPDGASACAQQAALRSFAYSPNFAAQLAADLSAVGHRTAARWDAAYAAWLFPLQLAVYRERGDGSTAYYARAAAAQRAGAAAWGTASPLPRVPDLPLTAEGCAVSLRAAGFPAGPFSAAMRGI